MNAVTAVKYKLADLIDKYLARETGTRLDALEDEVGDLSLEIQSLTTFLTKACPFAPDSMGKREEARAERHRN